MTPEREREIRKIAGREGQTWRSSAVSLVALNEVLDEMERLRGAAEGLEAWLTYMDSESEGLQFAQCDDKGRELGLWK